MTLCSSSTKKGFLNKVDEIDFKLEHMWRTLHYQSKWCTRHGDGDSSNGSKISHLKLDDDYNYISLESVGPPCPIEPDRARAQCIGKGLATSPLSWRD